MSKFYIILLLTAIFTTTSPKAETITASISTNQETTLLDDKIYFFAHSLSETSRDAYIYLHQNHPDLARPISDMKERHNLELYKQCVKKFNIPNKELKLPLFCFKHTYIMGWFAGQGRLLDKAIKEHQNK